MTPPSMSQIQDLSVILLRWNNGQVLCRYIAGGVMNPPYRREYSAQLRLILGIKDQRGQKSREDGGGDLLHGFQFHGAEGDSCDGG